MARPTSYSKETVDIYIEQKRQKNERLKTRGVYFNG